LESQLFEFLKQDLDAIRTEMREDFIRVNGKIDELISFKWQIIGGSLVVSAFLSVAVSIVTAIISK
jgi:hypothetical protein